MRDSPRRIFDIVLWSSLSNLVLLSAFLIGWNFAEIKATLRQLKPLESKAGAAQAAARSDRGDNELFTRGPQRQLKGELQLTAVSATPDAPVAATVAEKSPDEGQQLAELGPEGVNTQSMSPLLRRASGGSVEIGNFSTVSMNGEISECLDIGYGLLDDAGAPRGALKVLAESDAITMARICAANGTIVLTCRGGGVTISPRRPRPDDRCTG